jgi:hypothetical protein
MQLEFGLNLSDDISTPLAVWGARAITNEQGMIDLVYNRQAWYGETEHRKKLGDLINKYLPHIQLRYKQLLREGKVSMDKSNRVVLAEDLDANLHVEGNTNGSFGYLYLVAWIE